MINNSWPRISIITPSFNQANFLEKTICSVLDQGYPNLEYIIVDGGSIDGSVDIIKKYERFLAWWVSESDEGQAPAINKGLRRVTGDWIAWQNSDDIYYPGVFFDLIETAKNNPDAELIMGDLMLINSEGNPLRDIRYIKPNYKSILAEGMVIANQSAFWSRTLQMKTGFLNESYNCSFDYDWFIRLLHLGDAVHVRSFWGGLRLHNETKTSMLTPNFDLENKRILSNYVRFSKGEKFFYKFRRTVLMILEGQLYYVFRGLLYRLYNKIRGNI